MSVESLLVRKKIVAKSDSAFVAVVVVLQEKRYCVLSFVVKELPPLKKDTTGETRTEEI